MRTALAVLFLAVVCSQGYAEDRHPKLDDYFACIVGHGAVELNYGEDAAGAYTKALSDCRNVRKAAYTGGDTADDVLSVEETAYAALRVLHPDAPVTNL